MIAILDENTTQSEIARKLNMTPQTLHNEISRIFRPYVKKVFDKEDIQTILTKIESPSHRLLKAIMGYDAKDMVQFPDYDEDKLYNVILPSVLLPRELMVIQMRYGTPEMEHPYSLEEAGYALHVTRERVRQLEAKALRRLRNPGVLKKIFDLDIELNYENRVKDQITKEFDETMKRYVQMKNYAAQIEKWKENNSLKSLEAEPDIPRIPIDDIESFSVRTYNCLKRQNINYLNDLTGYTSRQVMDFRNLGRHSFNEILNEMTKYGMCFQDMELTMIEKSQDIDFER